MHSLLWVKNEKGEEAPAFWTDKNEENEDIGTKAKNIEQFADLMITTSSSDMSCINHSTLRNNESLIQCVDCKKLKQKVDKYQTHNHTATCLKKKKLLTIKETEGHGKLDGKKKGKEMKNIQICRFRFPRFPLATTKLIVGMSKDAVYLLVGQ